ncbi:MAG: hypothetical protein P1V20_28565 [Verrucomicrobiales bacterium]|nr:hypothetical protein [Verrucomicrobiales bacterium]
MMPNTTSSHQVKPENRATVPNTGIIKWIEPSAREEQEHRDYTPIARNQKEYFDDLQRAVAGLTALINSEMSASEILKRAEMEVKKIESETYDVVREFLGEEVTTQMKRINTDLDELASLVSGIEASLAGFSPLIEEEEAKDEANRSAA